MGEEYNLSSVIQLMVPNSINDKIFCDLNYELSNELSSINIHNDSTKLGIEIKDLNDEMIEKNIDLKKKIDLLKQKTSLKDFNKELNTPYEFKGINCANYRMVNYLVGTPSSKNLFVRVGKMDIEENDKLNAVEFIKNYESICTDISDENRLILEDMKLNESKTIYFKGAFSLFGDLKENSLHKSSLSNNVINLYKKSTRPLLLVVLKILHKLGIKYIVVDPEPGYHPSTICLNDKSRYEGLVSLYEKMGLKKIKCSINTASLLNLSFGLTIDDLIGMTNFSKDSEKEKYNEVKKIIEDLKRKNPEPSIIKQELNRNFKSYKSHLQPLIREFMNCNNFTLPDANEYYHKDSYVMIGKVDDIIRNKKLDSLTSLWTASFVNSDANEAYNILKNYVKKITPKESSETAKKLGDLENIMDEKTMTSLIGNKGYKDIKFANKYLKYKNKYLKLKKTM